MIHEFDSQLPIQENFLNEPENQTLQTSAYEKVGNGPTITVGSLATVSLKLSSSKSQINITVYNQSSPSTIIRNTTYYNQPADTAISYTWTTSSSTVGGTYIIRYSYLNATRTTAYDNYFTIYVTALIGLLLQFISSFN